jgi:four helix bundle protein
MVSNLIPKLSIIKIIMHDYKKLNVWKESIEFSVSVYNITGKFPPSEKYNLISQMNRSGSSIASNIAEGAGRNSPKDFLNFLSIANGSCFELETQLIISNRLKFVNDIDMQNLTDQITRIQKMIFNLQKTLKDQPPA